MSGWFLESIDLSAATLTRAAIERAIEAAENERRYPCGSERNPHLMHPSRYPDGPCVKCGRLLTAEAES